MEPESLKLPHDIFERPIQLTWQETIYVYGWQLLLLILMLVFMAYGSFRFYQRFRSKRKLVSQSTEIDVASTEIESFFLKLNSLGEACLTEENLASLSKSLKSLLGYELGQNLASKGYREIFGLPVVQKCRVEARALVQSLEFIETDIYALKKSLKDSAELERLKLCLNSAQLLAHSLRQRLTKESSHAV